jgi:hypothetical protein
MRGAGADSHTSGLRAKMLQSCALVLLALAATVAATVGEYSAIFEGGSAATHTLSFSTDAATGGYAESSMKFMVSTTALFFACHKHNALLFRAQNTPLAT